MDLESDHVPTDIELIGLAGAIGQNWEMLGMHLGLSRTTIEHIQMDNDTSAKRIHRMLLSWRQTNGEEATLDVLHQAMKEAKDVSIDWDAVPGVTIPKKRLCQDHMINKGYTQLKQQLKHDLVQLNREQLGTTAISPVREEVGASLLELYVSPTIKRVDQWIGTRKNTDNQETTLNDIFHEQSRRYQQIYISAEAGLGKTVFAKRIALIWCQANDPTGANDEEPKFSEEDLRVMKEFEFVFFVSLKDLDPCDCKIDDMIQNQVIGYLARSSKYSRSFIEDVLSREACLIILDGLDEWSHPAIGDCKMKLIEKQNNMPHKQSRGTCTFLTTTRPWKLIFASMSKAKIDRQFEIVGLDENASEELKTKVTEKLMGLTIDDDAEVEQKNFDVSDLEKKIEGIKGNPLLLMYLTCLQNENKSFGNSMCELYSNILEMLLQRTDPEEECEPFPEENIPRCFEENEQCLSYFSVVQDLGKLAFKTLFNLNGASRLVFSNKLAREYMSETQIKLWLKAGILTQTGCHKLLTGKKTEMSFVHKTFHEFFAALYMGTTNSDLYVEDVLKKCRHISQILEMKHTFVFLCGLCSNQSQTIMEKIATLVANDEKTVHFRLTTYPFLNYWEMYDLMEEFQSMMIDCMNENRGSGYNSQYRVEDVILHHKPNERGMSALKQLLGHVKLIKIGRHLSSNDVHEILQMLDLFKPEALQFVEKLDIWDTPNTEDIDNLLRGASKTLECLLIHGCKMNDNKEIEAYMQFSDSTLQILKRLESLESIDFFSVEMGHDQIKELIDWLEQRTCMTQIKLSRIKCKDHERGWKSVKCQMRNRRFDLSKHEHLTILGLGTMAMPEVKVNTSALEECWMERNQDIITYFLGNVVPTTSMLHTLVVEFVDKQEVVETIVNVLPQLSNLQQLQLKGMNLQDRNLTLSQRTVFRHIRLIEITLTPSAVDQLIDFFKICVKSVTTEIAACSIESDQANGTNHFENLKQKVESCRKFDVLYNLKCSGHANSFAFKTVV